MSYVCQKPPPPSPSKGKSPTPGRVIKSPSAEGLPPLGPDEYYEEVEEEVWVDEFVSY